MIEREEKYKVIDREEYDRIVEKAYNDMCESDLHKWIKQDFYAGFMAAFNFFSPYSFKFNNEPVTSFELEDL